MSPTGAETGAGTGTGQNPGMELARSDLARSDLARARLSGGISQALFRTLLWTLAEPGTIHPLPAGTFDPTLDGPTRTAWLPGISPAAWLALALADVDVTVHVAGARGNRAGGGIVDDRPGGATVGGDGGGERLERLIRMATGARPVPLEEAWLVILDRPAAALLGRVQVGDALHPERGARVGLLVDRLADPASTPSSASVSSGAHPGDQGRPAGEATVVLELSGPGVPGRRPLAVAGLEVEAARRLGRASGAFPAGFDTWLISAEGAVSAVPRSTTVTVLDSPASSAAGRPAPEPEPRLGHPGPGRQG